ncbi:MAG: hypothetical protein ABMB14_38960 [Myxococcota bacterium]
MTEPFAGWAFADRPAFRAVITAVALDAPTVPRTGETGTSSALALGRLDALGPRIADELRGAWARARYPSDPADAQVAAMWSRWGAGNPFGDQLKWVRLLDKPVTAAFRQALSARPLPPDVVARAIGDLRDALFYQLIGAPGSSGFAELAAYLLETGPGGPVRPVVEVLSPAARGVVAACVSRRGHWPRTLERALPDLAGPRERAMHLQGEADAVDAWIELHTALRLIESWSLDGGDDERDWVIVLQNHGRSRGRLRAVAGREPSKALADAILRLDGTAERTRTAARRWAWTWAWEALAKGFSFDLGQPVVRPCRAEPGLEPLDADDLAMLDGWFLLAVLRGRGATVHRWCTEGKGDPDGTWGRLLLEIPVGLRDPDGGFARVRAALAAGWNERVAALRPTIAAVAALPPGRRLKDQFWVAVGPVWPPAVARPHGGFPTFVRNAAAWVHGSEAAGGMPPRGERR